MRCETEWGEIETQEMCVWGVCVCERFLYVCEKFLFDRLTDK